jgi:16S rRNA (guanine966-N2)-methyltransferase
VRVIAGQAHGRRLRAPEGLNTRPTSARARESIFSRLAIRMELGGTRVLDLYAGSGSLGIEALSRGADSVVFVDSSRAATAVIAHNLRTMGLERRGQILAMDVRRALAELGAGGERFGLVFIDAPYRDDLSNELVVLLAEYRLVAREGWVVVEQSRRAPDAPPAPTGFTRATVATLGDHRIAFYRHSSETPKPT